MALVEWIVKVLHERPEVTFFVTITIGYAIGRLRIGSFTLGAVTGVLLAGVLVGQLGITLPASLKQVFFLLFLFSIGYRTGPQFFRGLKKDGLAQAALAVVFSVVGLAVAYTIARLAGYESGTAAGLIAGSLTEFCDDRNGRRCHLQPSDQQGSASSSHQSDTRGVRRDLSCRRDRGGVVSGPGWPTPPGSRSCGRVPGL